jgi:hypothetical protein
LPQNPRYAGPHIAMDHTMSNTQCNAMHTCDADALMCRREWTAPNAADAWQSRRRKRRDKSALNAHLRMPCCAVLCRAVPRWSLLLCVHACSK